MVTRERVGYGVERLDNQELDIGDMTKRNSE